MRVLSLFMLFAGFAVGLLFVGSQVEPRQVTESVRPVSDVPSAGTSALEPARVDEADLERRPMVRAQ